MQKKHFLKVLSNHPYIFLIVAIAFFLRVYGLFWGTYYFHPDEHKLTLMITNLQIPETLHPKYFLYGGFPVYSAYLSQIIFQSAKISQLVTQLDPKQSLEALRILSAISSTATVIVSYLLALKMTASKNLAYFVAFIITFSPGLIQAAHFGTYESLLSLFLVTVVLIAYDINKTPSLLRLCMLGIVIGLAIGTKANMLYLIGLPVLLSVKLHSDSIHSLKDIFTKVSILDRMKDKQVIVVLFVAFLTFAITNPVFISQLPFSLKEILSETAIARGNAVVFFTQQFRHTIPVLYQTTHILPLITGYASTVVILLGICIAFVVGKRKSMLSEWSPFLYVLAGWWIMTLPLFVKWTRYLSPSLPLMIILTATGFWYVTKKKLFEKYTWLVAILGIEILLRGVNFMNIYTQPDARTTAYQWLQQHAPQSTVLIDKTDPNTIIFRNFRYQEFSDQNTSLENVTHIVTSGDREHQNQLGEFVANKDTALALLYDIQVNPCFIPETNHRMIRLVACPIQETTESTFVVFDHPQIQIYEVKY